MSVHTIEVIPRIEWESSVNARIRENELQRLNIYSALFTLRAVNTWAIKFNIIADSDSTNLRNHRFSFYEVDSDMRVMPGMFHEYMADGLITCDFKTAHHRRTYIQPGNRRIDWDRGFLLRSRGPIKSGPWPRNAELGNLDG